MTEIDIEIACYDTVIYIKDSSYTAHERVPISYQFNLIINTYLISTARLKFSELRPMEIN